MPSAKPARSLAALLLIVAFPCWLLLSRPALALSISLTKIADTSMQIPGTATNFSEFGAVAIDAGTIAFRGAGLTGVNAGVFTGSGWAAADDRQRGHADPRASRSRSPTRAHMAGRSR